jgi:hypothetical protein
LVRDTPIIWMPAATKLYIMMNVDISSRSIYTRLQ